MQSEIKLSSQNFLSELKSLDQPRIRQNTKFITEKDSANKIMGVVMAELFALAKAFTQLPLKEIEKLLDNDFYEARMGAVCIMDFQARDKKTSPARKKELYDLYINKHERINNWDMVDRSAPYVVGGYLFDKSRNPLYKLARSKNPCERRTAIVATYFFIRQNDVNDTFKIAEMLVKDKDDLVNKAVGSWIREAGKRDPEQLFSFLDKHATTMPRVSLRYAVEKLDKNEREYYLKK
jgi:3-methyladenine DNA glycosylase AlkD